MVLAPNAELTLGLLFASNYWLPELNPTSSTYYTSKMFSIILASISRWHKEQDRYSSFSFISPFVLPYQNFNPSHSSQVTNEQDQSQRM
ncbi:hypothetical protein DsansV1_C09g0088441 [Dioscorea sansibarensis]